MTHASFWTASDGTRLHYLYDDFTDPWREAPLVVLLHSGLGSSLRLCGWVPHLARRYRVVRPDIRGHGKSEPGPDDGLTHERLALDLVELMDHFGAASAHVMGSSAGGMIAGRTALRHPARFRSLAMYAATAADDFTERMKELRMPMMLAVPDPDPMVEREEYARMRQFARHALFVEFRGASHNMTAEIPDACARAYADFLTRTDAA